MKLSAPQNSNTAFLKHFPPLLLTGICFLKLAHFCTSLPKFPVFDRPIPRFLLPVCFRLWASFGRRAWEFPPQLTSIKQGLLYSYHFLWLIARRLRDRDVVWCGACQTFRPWNGHWSLTARHVLKVFSSGVCCRLPVVRTPTAGRLSGSCLPKKMHYVVHVVGWNVDVRYFLFFFLMATSSGLAAANCKWIQKKVAKAGPDYAPAWSLGSSCAWCWQDI